MTEEGHLQGREEGGGWRKAVEGGGGNKWVWLKSRGEVGGRRKWVTILQRAYGYGGWEKQ